MTLELVTYNNNFLLGPTGEFLLGPPTPECCCVKDCCDSLPTTIYAHVYLCGNYVATLTEYANNEPSARSWEGCVTVTDGELCIRFACINGVFYYCIDGCGEFSCPRLNPAAGIWVKADVQSADCTSPYASFSEAPPSLCDILCGELMTVSFTDTP